MSPLELVAAAPWRRVVFTTYALSLSFFEAVLLDALTRGGGGSATILSDPEGIRSALSEQGARRAGRDYAVEPIACTTGAFHPKLAILAGDNDCHLLVGSGNLTFGGWGGNLEVVEHLHPSFAADAFYDAADFLESLTLADTIRTMAGEECLRTAEIVRRLAASAPRHGGIRLIHNVGGRLADAISGYVDGLGGATGLTLISPFFDIHGSAVDELARTLDCSEISVHAHPAGNVQAGACLNWPFRARMTVKPVCVTEGFSADPRPLHAKAFEIKCRRGRLLIAGSANATRAALYGGNVEVSVVRIQRDVSVGWSMTAGEAPPISEFEGDDDVTRCRRIGVLSAVLDGERIEGRVIAPAMAGAAHASYLTAERPIPLGTLEIDAQGGFHIRAPGLEFESWSRGRLVLQLEQEERTAEGFISVAAASDLIRRTGALAPRLMAMMAGTETPTDVAAILSWFREDPSRIPADRAAIGAAGTQGEDVGSTFVSLTALQDDTLWWPSSDFRGRGVPEPGWQRAMALVRAAFAPRTRGPWGGGTERDHDDDSEEGRKRRAQDEETQSGKIVDAFDDLLAILVEGENRGRYVLTALGIANYLSDRLRPAPAIVQQWLGRILGSAHPGLDEDERAKVAAAALLFYGSSRQDGCAARARRYLLRHGPVPAPDWDSIAGFAAVLGESVDLPAFALGVGSATTAGEQVRAYLRAADEGGPRQGYESLMRTKWWSRLQRALDDGPARARLLVVDEVPTACPRCSEGLSCAEREDLRSIGIAAAENCCSRLILCTET